MLSHLKIDKEGAKGVTNYLFGLKISPVLFFMISPPCLPFVSCRDKLIRSPCWHRPHCPAAHIMLSQTKMIWSSFKICPENISAANTNIVLAIVCLQWLGRWLFYTLADVGDVGVKKWSPFLDSGTRSPISRHFWQKCSLLSAWRKCIALTLNRVLGAHVTVWEYYQNPAIDPPSRIRRIQL